MSAAREPEDEMDDAIDAWQAGDGSQSLADYLGLTWDEYAAWVEGRAPDTRPRSAVAVLRPPTPEGGEPT